MMEDFEFDYEVQAYLEGWLGWQGTLYVERGW